MSDAAATRAAASKRVGLGPKGVEMNGLWWSRRGLWALVAVAAVLGFALPAAAATESRVTMGSPLTTFPQNKQNEPAVAIDASRPAVLAAGSNDELDLAPCGTTIFATAESP